jgi:sugar/nucleoside kinase (ribokinase family)
MAENAAASGRLVCFGELLARLSTQDYLPLADAFALNLHFAGAEANVAVQFSALGGKRLWLHACPETDWPRRFLKAPCPRGSNSRDRKRGGLEIVEFATAAAVWKHTVPGDWMRESWSDVEALSAGAGGVMVKR